MTDTDKPKPADKVWAMYDGPNCPDYITQGGWYKVDETEDKLGFNFLSDHGTQRFSSWRKSHHISRDNFQRHVGPTPPDAKEPAMQESSGLGKAYDVASADGWIAHDGNAKRPKGVGKRDKVQVLFEGMPDGGRYPEYAGIDVLWANITRYRITERAPQKQKRRKVWVVTFGRDVRAYNCEADARNERAVNGGTLYVAKLTPVKDTK